MVEGLGIENQGAESPAAKQKQRCQQTNGLEHLSAAENGFVHGYVEPQLESGRHMLGVVESPKSFESNLKRCSLFPCKP